MPANTTEIEKKLWASADSLRANSKLKASEYSVPVLGLIFLRFADHRFTQLDQELRQKTPAPGGRYSLSKIDYQAEGVMYLPEEACFSNLLKLPESQDIGKAINDAMKAIEAENEELLGVLFIDARHIYHQLDRAHREFTPAQTEFLANIVRLYRGEAIETTNGSTATIQEHFPGEVYTDIAGLCKVATLAEIETQGWSLSPGRYVGVTERPIDDFDFKERLEELNEECERCTDGNLRGKILTTVLEKHADDLSEEDHAHNRPDIETEEVCYKHCQAHADDHAKDTF
jgi:type I restriction-modification system DNA methylase subunit